MWYILLIHVCFPIFARSAWVEIPQVPTITKKTPAKFVFGSPKVTFIDQTTTTTPAKQLTTTPPKKLPTTKLPEYKYVMTSTTIQPLTTAPIRRSDNLEIKPKKQNQEKKEPNKNKYDTSFPFMPFLKSIQETLTQRAKKSLKSKISFLANLRDTLLANIDDRMSNLWMRSDVEARGHDEKEMDFPSNEGALLTIGFLTFAVFLIKLVLKLIHALKEKTMNPMVVTTISPTAFIGRKKRDLEDEQLKILQYIEDYRFT